MSETSSLSSDDENEEEIDTTALLDMKNLDAVEKVDSENYTSNPYMIIDNIPYITNLIQESLSLCKSRILTIGVVTSIWFILLITGVVLWVTQQKQCLFVERWSKFTLCALGYIFLTYLAIFLVELYIYMKIKYRLSMYPEKNLQIPEIVKNMMQHESLLDLLCIGNRINDITVRRKMIKDICNGKDKVDSFNKLIIHDRHFMLKAFKKTIKVSASTIFQITAPQDQKLYNHQYDNLVNKYFIFWVGIPIFIIIIWIGMATDIGNDVQYNEQHIIFDNVTELYNVTDLLYSYNMNCNSIYIFNIIMMSIASLQTIATFIPFFIRILWMCR